MHSRYDGHDIVLPDDPAKILSPEKFPYLHTKIGDDIITAGGKTLLGADDKAGVAIIMTLAAELLANPELPHGDICICFSTNDTILAMLGHRTGPQRDFFKENETGHIDLPRARRGGLGGGFFAMFTPSPQRVSSPLDTKAPRSRFPHHWTTHMR